VPHFRTSAAPSGAGKTYAATTFTCKRIPLGMKSAIIQPTIALCKQSYIDARTRFPDIKDRIRTIVTKRGSDDRIALRITNHLNSRDETGDLLFVTHAGFLRTPHWHRANTWNLFIDEAMEVTYHRKFTLRPKHRNLLIDLINVRPSRHERYGMLEARYQDELDDALAQMDDIDKHFADFIWRLRHGHWNLYVDHAEYEKFTDGNSRAIEVHGLLSPTLFEPFASATIMGANLSDSIMFKYFAKEGCTFSNHTAISNGLRYQNHNNGARLLIKYISDRTWSKTLRNAQLAKDDSPEDVTENVCDVYMRLCREEAAKHSGLPPLWIGNNDILGDEFDGERLKNVPHGMNRYQTHDVCCIFSALNPPQAHRKFLQDLCGMTEREVRRALLSQTAYQACGRGILRQIDSTGIFLLIVPDRDTAEDIAQYYPGCRIEKLISDIEEPKIGRPPKYETDLDKADARREQDRLRKQRVRKKSLYLCDSADKDQTPEQIRHDLVRTINEWAELTLETTGLSGFALSNWLSKTDRIGQGNSTFVATTNLVAQMRRRQDIVRVCKEANLLICPTLFRQPLRLPDHLSAIGITIESSVRTKENALACRALFLDIENGEMTPDDFARVFRGLEFFAYSSWSHTPDAPRYRICIPSTQFIAPDIHALILHTIVDRLERAGWGDGLADGKKHGVDIGKLHEAAMFYLPSKRPDCFLAHFHEGRKPLDPREWVDLIPEDLLASPPPPVPQEVYHYEFTPAHKDKRVQWAIDYWRCRGCAKGKGRTQFWLLAKRLAEAGCDDAEIDSILSEQAAFATNPDERRGEIAELLSDHQVMAARRTE
jgi:hypothetical protein